MPVGVIERVGPSLAPACLFACSVLPNGQPRASRASCWWCCCSAQPRRLRLSFPHVSNTYMCVCVCVCITSRNADLIFRHSHPLQTRTFACVTMNAASVPTHAVAQGRRQLPRAHRARTLLISAAAFTHITIHCLQSSAFQSLWCQLEDECYSRCYIQHRYARLCPRQEA